MRPLHEIAGIAVLACFAASTLPAQGLFIRDTVCDVDFPTCVGGIQGLRGVRMMAPSPDGAHVYAPVSLDDALQVFALLPSGELDPLQSVFDTDPGIDGLDSARGAAVSPDGDHVYVAALLDSSLAAFERNPVTGTLTFIEVEKDGQGGVDGLAGAHAVAVSPDGAHVYVAARSEDAVSVFTRNPVTGAITFLEAHFDNQAGVDGLNAAEAIAVSPDGTSVYVAGEEDNAVAVFDRETAAGPDFGRLTFVEAEFDGVGGADGLQGADGVAVAPDGENVYVGCLRGPGGGDWISVFSRSPATGALTFQQVITEEGAGIDYTGCFGVGAENSGVAVSPDDGAVYATNPFRGTVAWFDRAGNGTLTLNSALCDEGTFELVGAASITTDPSGRRLLTAAPASETVAVLVQGLFSDGFESGDTGAWSVTVP